MQETRFNPDTVPAHLIRPPQVRQLTWLVDALGLLLMGTLLWVGLGLLGLELPTRNLLLRLWLLAGVLGWLLSRRGGAGTRLSPGRPVVVVPLRTLLVAGALFLAVGEGAALPWLLALHGLWFGLTLLALGWIWRVSPPLRLGVSELTLSATGQPPLLPAATLHHPRVQFVPVSPRDPGMLEHVDLLLVEPERGTSTDYQRLLEHAYVTQVPFWPKVLADEELTGRVALHAIDREGLTDNTFRSGYEPFKHALDIVVTLLLLPLLLPLLAAVALVVYFNSGRPVLFWQERVGRNGQPFQIAKFRTMTTDSERSGPAFARQGDMRVTPVGALLRKFRLDELPQFWNVLRGEMSIIGPRPEQWAFAADFEESIPLYACRHWVRPGITGWAQVNQGYTDNLGQTTEKLRYDLYYVKHLSLSLDLLIVGKTIWTILTGFGSR
ncbi:hypothetical protein Dcar01_00103 [Deinococcus carri]|uniref:Bacterial sugar transferase domain-containing protein n=1 Tax=Deinococcus carri TaxID=1211323 RepID=A0ABP9W200_9DEIO